MAKYDITHACGHEETVELFGSHESRDSRIEKMEADLCPRCRAERARKIISEGYNGIALPQISGSDKQVAWAVDIIVQSINNHMRSFDPRAISDAIGRHTDARYWIDHQYIDKSECAFEGIKYMDAERRRAAKEDCERALRQSSNPDYVAFAHAALEEINRIEA